MAQKLKEFLGEKDASKKISFEKLVLFALNLSAHSENSAGSSQGHRILSEGGSQIVVQQGDHEVRLTNVIGTVLEANNLNEALYRGLKCSEVKKLCESNANILNKVLSSNSCTAVSDKLDMKTYRGVCAVIADEELNLDSENESAWNSFEGAEVDNLIPRSRMCSDAAALKHVVITDSLKFHCKLCDAYIDMYEDLFLHLNAVLHQVLTIREERRLDFVHHHNLLLKMKQVRELLADEGDHITILQGENYFCNLCDKCFTSEVDVFMHVTTLKHQILRVKNVRRQCYRNGLGSLLRRNGMLCQSSIWQCCVCKVSSMMLADAVMHIKKKTHKENIVCEHEVDVHGQAALGSLHKEIDVENINISKNRNCVRTLLDSKIQVVTKHENEILQNKIFQEEYKYLLYMCKDIFFCKLCTTFVSAYGVDYHVYSSFHVQALEGRTVVLARLWFMVRLLEQGDFGNIAVNCVDLCQFDCRLCSVKSLQIDDVLPHVSSESHMMNVQQGSVQYRRLPKNMLRCRLCRTAVPDEDYAAHVHSESHQVAFSKHMSKLQLKEMQQTLFRKLPKILNHHEDYFKPISDTETWCMLCMCNMPLIADDVWAHINDSYHISHMNFQMQKILSSLEVVDEDKVMEKEDRMSELALNGSKDNANSTLNDSDVLENEASSDENVQENKKKERCDIIDAGRIIHAKFCVIPDSIKKALSSRENFHKHCTELCELSGSDFMDSQNCQIISMLLLALRPVFPDCSVVAFGSRLAGFAVPTSDIDLYVDVGSKLQSHEHQVVQSLFVRMSYRLLSSRSDCRNLKEVPYARTPIVKFTYIPLKIDCDVNFMNEMSIQNTKLVRFYSTLDERVKMLILLVRHWAKLTDATRLGTAAKISNYALTLLVIFYLQQLDKPVVPTVEFLQAHHNGEKKFIRGWNCSFAEDQHVVPRTCNTTSTAKLLHNFFQFFSDLDFSQVVVCLHCGRGLVRNVFVQWMRQQRMHNGEWEKFRLRSPMCVQDPFDLSHNVTKGVNSKCLSSFQVFCQVSANLTSLLLEDCA